jgi:integrase
MTGGIERRQGMTTHIRTRGEGSIYPYRNGHAGYVWVTTLSGEQRRKHVYGDTRAEVHARWIDVHHKAARYRLATRSPRLVDYLARWLHEVIAPFAKPKTTETYTAVVARYITPYLGDTRVDALTVADVRRWLHRLATACQCCQQGKDAGRPQAGRRCCAVGRCCQQHLSRRTVLDARAVLRVALAEAMTDQLIRHNPAAAVRLPAARPRRRTAWTVEQAREFLASARDDTDPLYPAYVLLLCLGLRRGELLGLHWDDVDLNTATVHVHRELQRVGSQLLLSQTKTLDSDASLPLPPLCLTTLRGLRSVAEAREPGVGVRGFVVATRTGTPIDPRNFYRSFQRRAAKAAVPRIPLHGTRHTCASLLVELDVHPRVAMQILRHAKIATTMDVYTHVPTRVTRMAIDQLSAQLEHPHELVNSVVAAGARSTLGERAHGQPRHVAEDRIVGDQIDLKAERRCGNPPVSLVNLVTQPVTGAFGRRSQFGADPH